jgi:hypothetical protein
VNERLLVVLLVGTNLVEVETISLSLLIVADSIRVFLTWIVVSWVCVINPEEKNCPVASVVSTPRIISLV